MEYLILFLFGIVFGSFISALSWRMPRNISFLKGRSFCDNCGKKITWKDNIPVISYLLLNGKCSKCGKKISIRYPLIELFTGFVFLIIGMVYLNCSNIMIVDSPICNLRYNLFDLTLPYLLIVSVVLISIFVIDLEHKIIPDELVFMLLSLAFIQIFISDVFFWERMFAGFAAGLFLLSLNLITAGKGMGLGDAKLAVPIGIMLGIKGMIVWMFLSFLAGSIIGLILIAVNKAKFGKQIAFGPFLVLSFFISIIIGGIFESFIFLY